MASPATSGCGTSGSGRRRGRSPERRVRLPQRHDTLCATWFFPALDDVSPDLPDRLDAVLLAELDEMPGGELVGSKRRFLHVPLFVGEELSSGLSRLRSRLSSLSLVSWLVSTTGTRLHWHPPSLARSSTTRCGPPPSRPNRMRAARSGVVNPSGPTRSKSSPTKDYRLMTVVLFMNMVVSCTPSPATTSPFRQVL